MQLVKVRWWLIKEDDDRALQCKTDRIWPIIQAFPSSFDLVTPSAWHSGSSVSKRGKADHLRCVSLDQMDLDHVLTTLGPFEANHAGLIRRSRTSSGLYTESGQLVCSLDSCISEMCVLLLVTI